MPVFVLLSWTMKNLLVKFALWILRKYNSLPAIPQPIRVVQYPRGFDAALRYLSVAKVFIAEQEAKNPDHSGEAKRHAVYGLLIKKFPEARKRDLAKAIELGMD